MFHFLGDHLHMRNNSRWAPLLYGNSYSRPGNSSLNVLNNKIGQNQNYTKAHYPPPPLYLGKRTHVIYPVASFAIYLLC